MLSNPAIIESLITDDTDIIDNDCSEDNVKSTSDILNMIQAIQLCISSNEVTILIVFINVYVNYHYVIYHYTYYTLYITILY